MLEDSAGPTIIILVSVLLKGNNLDLFSRVCGVLMKPQEQIKPYQPWCFFLALVRDHISASQPEPRRIDSGIGSGILDNEDGERTLNGLCFSQPVHPDHMLLGTQMQSTPGASQVKPISFLWLSWLVQYCRQQWWWWWFWHIYHKILKIPPKMKN